ncbi:MAG: type III secretion T3S chaperone [Parachlamydiales bacterium]|nr:type III secretion T3S chaperone [Parachlamydiales bacterium]
MAKIVYPLEQVLEVKHKRVDEAEKVVQEKLKIVEQETQKLREKEAERDKAKTHYQDKLQQLRDELDKVGSTSTTIRQMRDYLKLAKEALQKEDGKVTEQKKAVDAAQQILEDAQRDLKIKRHEVDKLETHKEEWLKVEHKEADRVEGIEQDEIGTTIFLNQKIKKKQE